MAKCFVASSTDMELLQAFGKISRLPLDDCQIRCIHAAGIAAALALCKVDITILLAAREAAKARQGSYEMVLQDCLPANAHDLVSSKLIIILKEASGVKSRRRFTSKQNLITRLLAAMDPLGSAWSLRAEYKSHNGWKQIQLNAAAPSAGDVVAVSPSVDLSSAAVLVKDAEH